jgi:hypothetical protein
MKQYFKPGIILAAALALGLIPFGIQADEHDKKTVITVDEPIQVVDTYLEPGTYVFKLIESSSDRHTVEIYNKNQSHLIKLMFAVPNYRLIPTSTNHSQFTFWETPPGTPKAVRAWFYPGDNYGHEFPYPDNLRQLSTAATATTTVAAAVPAPQPAAAVTETEKSEAVTPAPQPAPQQALEEEQPRQEEPVQIAQNTPAPEPQVQTPVPQPASETKEPEELPKTASPYPLIGLGGLLFGGLYAMLRMKRLA